MTKAKDPAAPGKNHVDASKGIEKALAVASALIGQAPWITTITGVYPLSLYQPSIYHGIELFLLVPVMVGVFFTWTVVRWQNSMWWVFGIFLLLSGFVYWAHETLPPVNPFHPINWILSYCAFALFVAALSRAAMDVLGTSR
ncbi:MAG TPA: hypothetical protein VNO18_22595 [Xanthobacteraceae bacterium]|nr:hypothetical protein [Xanthobacteraceae bacterium]